MAGGEGKRLLPYTTVLPKPLMPLGNDMTVIELLLRQLSSQHIRTAYVAVNYLRHLIQTVLGDGSALGVEIRYAIESSPLGTGGPVAQVLDDMSDDFLLLNGDLLTDLDFAGLRDHHIASGADATVAAIRRTSRVDYGVLDVDAAGRLVSIREKPTTEHLLSMGVYALKREAVRPFLSPGEALDMPSLLTSMVAQGLRVDCRVVECQWLDIGRPEDFQRAQTIVEGGYGAFLKT